MPLMSGERVSPQPLPPEKLEVKNTASLVKKAIQLGLID